MFSGRIAQILDNILQNALSFSPAEGMITVQTPVMSMLDNYHR